MIEIFGENNGDIDLETSCINELYKYGGVNIMDPSWKCIYENDNCDCDCNSKIEILNIIIFFDLECKAKRELMTDITTTFIEFLFLDPKLPTSKINKINNLLKKIAHCDVLKKEITDYYFRKSNPRMNKDYAKNWYTNKCKKNLDLNIHQLVTLRLMELGVFL